jgi:transposase-like protein
MDPQPPFCPNLDCPARGQVGEGNITSHGRKRPRSHCKVCGQTFSARRDTPFYRRRSSETLMTQVLTLVAHGCPIAAIEAAFGLQARTVRKWIAAAGQHAQAIQEQLVEQPRDLQQVQADEIRVKMQRGILWMAMALMASTRLWLGGTVSLQRDLPLILRLAQLSGRCAIGAPLLLITDGLASYPTAFARVFRTKQRTGRRGAPRLIPWPQLNVVQVVKAGRGTVGMVSRLICGSGQAVLRVLRATPGCTVVNTAYIERLNGTFRARLACLARRTRGLARQQRTLEHGMYLVGTIYNFCTFHGSLATPDRVARTPAMAAGITDHRWSVHELLQYHVPPPCWQPPQRRGRRSKHLQALIDRWVRDDHHLAHSYRLYQCSR